MNFALDLINWSRQLLLQQPPMPRETDINNNKAAMEGEESGEGRFYFELPYLAYYEGARRSDIVLTVIIGLMSVALAVLWLDYRRLKTGGRSSRNRRFSEMLVPSMPDVREALKEVAEFVVPMKPQRFRKRDRVYFHGRRLVRKMQDNVGTLAKASRDPSARRKVIARITKNFLSYGSGSSSECSSSEGGYTGLVGPAEEYLDEDSFSEANGPGGRSSPNGPRWVPPELTYLLNSFHMFGHFDKAVFFELCRSLQTVHVPAGQYLFRIGDQDEFVFVVQSGQLNVHILDNSGPQKSQATTTIKVVSAGETVSSLLSFIDCLTGYPSSFKTVCCRAITDTVVLKLPASSFAEIFEKNPEMLIRVIQLIMARLQRVIFVALHQYLGLTGELIRHIPKPEEADHNADKSETYLEQWGMDSMMESAVRGFQAELDIDNVEFLRDRIELRMLSAGDIIMTEDSHNDAALVYIISGSVTLSQCSSNASAGEQQESAPSDRVLYTAYKGECVGQLAMLTGEANFYTCIAHEPSRVAILTREAFFAIVCATPEIVLRLAHNTIARLSPLVRQIDFSLDWVTIESGKALFRQGEVTDGTFIVLSGRLRKVIASSDDCLTLSSGIRQHQPVRKKMAVEYVKGDMVGLVDVVTATNRIATVMAVRDSELCKIPANLLSLLKARYHLVVTRLISLLGHRLLGTWANHRGSDISEKMDGGVQPSYTTVALYPASRAVPITAFALELEHALTAYGHVIRLSSSVIKDKLGSTAFDSGHDYRLNAWLGQQEHRHKVVIYQCDYVSDYEMTRWTSLCLRQSDVIFDLVLADDAGGGEVKDSGDSRQHPPAEVTPAEKQLEGAAKRVRKELFLIHSEETLCPRNTREWLRRRPWISSHFHVKAPKRLFLRRSERRLAEYYLSVVQAQIPNIHSDFSRLARHVCGTSVGLVLGGGGARGAAHVGMMKSIYEAGIPIDKVGGVSIGSLVGGLWGSSRDMSTVTQRARSWFESMGNRWGLLDLTYPATALFTGAYFNSTLSDTFGEELMIEDLWLPFFCCTTDITISQERVHTKGIFWKYCRASMSYAWLLPPLCDPEDGHLLMDGCYVNNVPGDIMANQNCKYILAIDVTALDDRELTNYGDTLSGWWLLWKRLTPFASPVKIPDQAEIQLRLAFCSHYKNLEELKSNPNYEYIQPPIEKYASGAFNLFDEIREIGYHHGTTFFAGLRKAAQSGGGGGRGSALSNSWNVPPSPGSSPPWFPAGPQYHRQWTQHRLLRRDSGPYNYTDLAQMVCDSMKEGVNDVPPSSSLSRTSSGTFRSRSSSNTAKRPQSGKSQRANPVPYNFIDYSSTDQESDDDSDDTGIMLS